jgi:hypothetical protein
MCADPNIAKESIMDGFIKDERLLKPGPNVFFQNKIFVEHMTLRECHAQVMREYRNAIGKYARPLTIYAKDPHVVREYTLKEMDVVVEILPSYYESLTKWEGDIVKPRWKVRIARDPNGRMRSLKDPMIPGPTYHLGKVGSSGPFTPLSRDKFAVICN